MYILIYSGGGLLSSCIITGRMHALLARYGVYTCGLMGTKLCELIAKLEITVWNHPGNKDIQ